MLVYSCYFIHEVENIVISASKTIDETQNKKANRLYVDLLFVDLQNETEQHFGEIVGVYSLHSRIPKNSMAMFQLKLKQ